MATDSDYETDLVLCSSPRRRLYELFGLIEKEFEALHAENFALRAKVEALTERLTEGGALAPEKAAEILEITAADVIGASTAAKVGSAKKASHVGQKLKTAFRVVPAPGRNLVSSFKANVQLGGGGGDASRIRFVQAFAGHRDGVWDAAVASPSHIASSSQRPCILGSASADQTARVWCVESGAPLLVYVGHSGSVNGISFHNPTALDCLLAATASGDQSAHIWKVVLPNLPAGVQTSTAQQAHSSEDELEQPYTDRAAALSGGATEESAGDDVESHSCATIRTPLMQLTGHTSAVIAVDWLYGGDQVITASWDRTANVYDVERGEILNVLTGHDQELNHCSAHSSRKLVVTASKDTTFRLWDFRDPIYSVAVFQGHNESVSSAVFSSGDKVVSGSDDRTVKVWDLKNMRTALATIRTDSPVNRLALSQQYNVIAIPHDNRNVRLYDLNGNRVGRLPRSSRRGHRRMVCCAAWADDNAHCNLFTCGFDKQLLGWKVAIPFGKDNKD